MKPLAITIGDPAGIGPEIVGKALAALDVPARVFGAVPRDVRHGEISGEYGRVALQAVDDAVAAVARGE